MSFWRQAGRMLNAGQTRTLMLTGNVNDLFPIEEDGCVSKYAPLIDGLVSRWSVSGCIVVVYELNGPIRFASEVDHVKVRDQWMKWRTGMTVDEIAIRKMLAGAKDVPGLDQLEEAFDDNLKKSVGKPTIAFELLRQMCLCSRSEVGGRVSNDNLMIIIEGADMALPAGPIHQLSDADRHRIGICKDWFSDPGFMEAGDMVVMVAESRSQINERIGQMPQVLSVDVPSPDQNDRLEYITWFDDRQPADRGVKSWSNHAALATSTAGLSLHALRQLLAGACYQGGTISPALVAEKVEGFIQSQLGEDIVEFKKPEHSLDDVIGFSELKAFLHRDLIPRVQDGNLAPIPGAAVCGPIGGGKTFIFEAVSAELDMVVLTLKNVRSQWFGQTDVIFERLRRVLEALSRVMIFVDEADTQFGSVSASAHATERRLTGKIQAMMSDPRLKGKVFWLLMTARIQMLSPDIRRPGRVGDLIIPVLDPEGEDRDVFLQWMLKPVMDSELSEVERTRLLECTEGYFSSVYASMRNELKACAAGGRLSFEEVLEVLYDHLPPPIADTRREQTLQALLHCTRRRLLPDPEVDEETRQAWADELAILAMKA